MDDPLDAILEAAAEELLALRQEYEESLRSQQVSARMQVRIKNIVENQRSVLDHLAFAITQRYGKASRQTYYPLARSEADFEALFKGRMPGVAELRPDIYDVIRLHQPWQEGHVWLAHLNEVTQENKHRALTPQTRTGTRRITPGPGGGFIGTPGGLGISLGEGSSITISDGASISFGGEGPFAMRNIVQTVFVDWLFENPRVSVLGLLGEVQSKLPPMIAHIRQVATL